MEKTEIVLVGLMKSKKGKIGISYLVKRKQSNSSIGYDNNTSWIEEELVNFDELKNYILQKLYATFTYKDTYGDNAIRVLECVFDDNGEALVG